MGPEFTAGALDRASGAVCPAVYARVFRWARWLFPLLLLFLLWFLLLLCFLLSCDFAGVGYFLACGRLAGLLRGARLSLAGLTCCVLTGGIRGPLRVGTNLDNCPIVAAIARGMSG